MRVTEPVPEGARDRVLARLHDPAGWSRWVPGLRDAYGDPSSVRLRFGGPRPFGCTVAVTRHDDGVTFELEEGDVATLNGTVRVLDGQIVAELELQFGVNVPGVLWTTIEKDVLPAALAEITRPDAPSGSDPHGD